MQSSKSAPPLILLVDDREDGLAARKSVLEAQGYKTVIASSAHVALEAFKSQAFDLVVTDYKMPEMSGIDLIQLLRKIRPDVPIILISGFVHVLGLDEGTTGADTVIAKSSNEVQLLVRAVQKLLTRKKPVGTLGDAPKTKRRGSVG